ncbi:antibiotic biosynthesis monooxygenase [Granulosicoccaceae sp. 1_MG-2023]|nr:antibiotic biosynthesis monooxygenase [Granulosicoccaceae sp. 1_MG-2023]
MFVAMNRFKVKKDRTADFEARWRNRDSHLKEMPGFTAFHLLKGPEADDHILYASHTIWETREAFEAWTHSDAFRKAHANAGSGNDEPVTIGPPQFEGFESVVDA